jgi:hypothetical protein
MAHIQKAPPPYKGLAVLIAIVLFLIAAILLQSCSAAKKLERQEKKALAPYIAVATDIDENFAEKKLELGSRYCETHFPSQEKTIVKDSIITKYVRIADNALINRLKAQITAIKTTQPNVNLDSLYSNFYDSVLFNLPPCKEVNHFQSTDKKGKDTIALFRAGVIIEKLKNDTNFLSIRVNYLNLQLTLEKEKTATYAKAEKSISYLAGKLGTAIWDKIKWWLLAALIIFGGYKLLRAYTKIKLPFIN